MFGNLLQLGELILGVLELLYLIRKPCKNNNKDTKYWIQVGAFKVRDNAVKQVNRLKDSGFSSFVKEMNGLFVVQAGAFNTKQAAMNQLENIKKKGFDALLKEHRR